MPKRKIICFLVYRIEKQYRRQVSRPYKVAGLQATVHATSKTSALKLLQGKFPGVSFKVIANTECNPSQILAGEHCIRNLIIKDDRDETPLGYILPNSPEWHKRFGAGQPNISKGRQEKIKQIQKRKDIF